MLGLSSQSSSSGTVEAPRKSLRRDGWVGNFNSTIITGWIRQDEQDPSDDFLDIYLNGRKIGQVLACEDRQQASSGVDAGEKRGFRFHLPKGLNPSDGDKIEARPVTQPLQSLVGKWKSAQSTSASGYDGKKSATYSVDSINEMVRRVKASTASSDQDFLSETATAYIAGDRHSALGLELARKLVSMKELPLALSVLDVASSHDRGCMEVRFYRSYVLNRMRKFQEASVDLEFLYSEGCYPDRTLAELIRSLVGIIETAGSAPNRTITDKLINCCRTYQALELPAFKLPNITGNLLVRLGELQIGSEIIERHIQEKPNLPDGYVAKSRMLIERSNFHEALELSRMILEKWPDNEPAKFNLRVLHKLERYSKDEGQINWKIHQVSPSDAKPGRPSAYPDLSSIVKSTAEDFILFLPYGATAAPVNSHLSRDIGCYRLADGQYLWNRRALSEILASGLCSGPDFMSELEAFSPRYCGTHSVPQAPGKVALVSRHAPYLFGGAEHFLWSMARQYASIGFEPVFVGTDWRLGEKYGLDRSGTIDGIPYAYVDQDAAELRRVLHDMDVQAVHCISGSGFVVSEAVAFTNIAFVYGVHFWREAFGHLSGDQYFDADANLIPRQDFSYILSRATTAYANSDYTQKVVEAAHGVRLPVLMSIADEVEETHA